MPLSDHDNRIIHELEEQLAAEDPRLARTLSQNGIHRRSMHLTIAGLAFVALGIAVMAVALRIESVVLGVGAFMMMASGLYLSTLPAAVTGWPRGGRKAASNSSAMPGL